MPAIAIVTHNSAGELRRHFAAVLDVARRLGVGVAVVDNASTDGTPEFLREQREEDPSLIVSFQAKNGGYAWGVNVAVALLGNEDVMLMNPDVHPTEQAVLDLVGYMNENPTVAVAAPRLRFPDGELQPSVRRPASLAAMIGSLSGNGAGRDGFFRRSYERYLDPAGSPGTGEADWVIGAAMLIRRLAFEEVGGFDPGFFLYMEDADFCRRCSQIGWDVRYVSEVTMEHEYGRASSAHDASFISSSARRHHVASLARYWRKHPSALFGIEAK